MRMTFWPLCSPVTRTAVVIRPASSNVPTSRAAPRTGSVWAALAAGVAAPTASAGCDRERWRCER